MNSLYYCYSSNVLTHRKAIHKWLASARVNQAQVQWYIDKPGPETPELNQLRKDIQHNNPKTIITYSLSDLSTSLSEGIEFLDQLFNNNGRIVAIKPAVDIGGSNAANLMHAIIDLQRHYQSLGIQAAKERGAYKGRKKGALKPGNYVEKAVELRKQGMTYDAIAKELDLSRSTVIKYINIGLS